MCRTGAGCLRDTGVCEDTQSGKTVWTKDVNSEYTAKVSDAFAGVERLRLANEGAARENIRQAISDMAALTL
jgi:hypothetical protein